MGDAARLAERGKDADARLYKLAAALNNPEDKQLWDQELRWAPGLNRPVYALEFGLAMEIKGPGAQQPNQPGGQPGGAVPLPAAIPIPGAAPNFGAAGGDADQQLQQQQQAQLQQLQQAAGPIASQVIESLKLRTNAGLFGGKPGNQPAGGGNFGAGRFGGGNFGGGGALGRGMTMVGVGDRKTMLAAAEAAQVDVLMFFDIDTMLNRKINQVTATIRVRLYDVQTGRHMFQTKSLTSAQVAMARSSGNNNFGNNNFGNNNNQQQDPNDPIVQFTKSIIDHLDKNLMLQNLPATFEADDVRKRIEALAKKPPKNKLPHLVELKLYERKGALPPDEIKQGIEQLLGPIESKILFEGKEKERNDLLGRMLPPLPLDMRPKDAVVAGGPKGPAAIDGPIEGRRLLGIKLPDTPFQTIGGQNLNLAAGGNVMLVHFWSTSEPNIKKQLDTLSQVHASYNGQGLVIVGVCLDGDRAAVDKLLAEKKVTWHQFFDGQGAGNVVSRKLGMRSAGLNLLVDKTGTVRHVNVPTDQLSQVVGEMMR